MEKKKKKETETPKEHQQPWQEKYASPQQTWDLLNRHVMLRYNEVRGRTEIHWLSRGPVIREDEQGLLTIFGDDEVATDGYAPLTDRNINKLWYTLNDGSRVLEKTLRNVIESDLVPGYHPFRYYLDSLPPWKEGDTDHIMGLSLTVNVKGGSDEQILFYLYLKKWLVAMVASWVDPKVVNNVMLILIGEQGTYKTTWFAHLLPPQLREYFYTKTDSAMLSKDDRLVLSQYGLVCWEELDTMQPKELNKMKGAMTMPSVNERKAYGRYHETLPHVASFCGTGNNVQFLTDTTGNRRWLPFEVESIESPLTSPFDYDNIYAQAYALYRQGFRYWFSTDEVRQLARHNERFEVSKSEQELVDLYFRRPAADEHGEFMPVSLAMQIVGANITQKLSKEYMGRAFMDLGFEFRRTSKCRGYIVVRRTNEEMMAYRQGLAAGRQETVTDDGMTAVF